jgi:hypothetical protein
MRDGAQLVLGCYARPATTPGRGRPDPPLAVIANGQDEAPASAGVSSVAGTDHDVPSRAFPKMAGICGSIQWLALSPSHRPRSEPEESDSQRRSSDPAMD